jgi:hypothetical protein
MQPARCQPSGTSTVTMVEVNERIGQELAALAEAVRHLQNVISPLILEAAGRNPSHLHELQDFDHIAQKIDNLGNFVTTLAAHVPAHWLVDPSTASQAVTLSHLSSRLAFTEESEADAGHVPGDFELF